MRRRHLIVISNEFELSDPVSMHNAHTLSNRDFE